MFSGAAAPSPCDNCGCTEFPLSVLRTNAYYVGTACKECGSPQSRESGYFKKREQAEKALAAMQAGDLSETRAVDAGLTPGVSTPKDA